MQQSDELFINDKKIELAEGTVIALTLQINDLGELKDRQSTYSNQFKVPRTAWNRLQLEQAGLIQSTTRLPYKKNQAKVRKGGLEFIARGHATLESTDEFYNLTVNTGIIDLIEKLGQKKLSDLKLPGDHTLDVVTVYTSRLNNSEYIYGVVDYNNNTVYCDDVTPKMNMSRNAPLYYVHSIVEAIFYEEGVPLEGELFNRDKYKRLLLQLGTDGFTYKGQVVGVRHIVGLFDDDTQVGPNILLTWMSGGVGSPTNLNGWWQYFGADKGKLVFDREVRLSSDLYTDWTVNFRLTSAPSLVYYHAEIYRYDTATVIARGPDVAVDVGQTINGSWSVRLDSGTYPSGTELAMRVIVATYPSGPTATVEITASTLTMVSTGGLAMSLHNPVVISEHVPDMTQAEFLKAILAHMFAGLPSIDQYSGHYKVVQFDEILDAIPRAKKWERKLHMDERTWKEEYRIGYAQRNWFKYAEDDQVQKGYGDGYFDIDDEVLEKEKTILTLPFAATHWVNRFGTGAKIPIIQLWDKDGKAMKTKPRILLLDRDISPSSPYIDIHDGVTGPITLGDNVPHCHFLREELFENLGWQNSMLNDEYEGLIGVLRDLKKFTGFFKLHQSEVHQLDLYKPLYVKELGAFFYVNKVVGFTGDGYTKIELIRFSFGADPEAKAPELRKFFARIEPEDIPIFIPGVREYSLGFDIDSSYPYFDTSDVVKTGVLQDLSLTMGEPNAWLTIVGIENWQYQIRIKLEVVNWTDGSSILEIRLDQYGLVYAHPDTGGGGGVGVFNLSFVTSMAYTGAGRDFLKLKTDVHFKILSNSTTDNSDIRGIEY